MLDLVGRKADGWLASLGLLEPEQAYWGLDRIRSAASRPGRDPEALTYGYNVGVLVKEGAASTTTRGLVSGGPEEVAGQLAGFVRGGFSFLNLSPAGDGIEQRERLAHEVLPILRAGRDALIPRGRNVADRSTQPG